MGKAVLVACFTTLTVLAGACSFTTAKFSHLAVASQTDQEYNPTVITNTFETTAPFVYVTGSVDNAPEGTAIKAEWVYLGSSPDYNIDSTTLDMKNTSAKFQFSLPKPDTGWPTGQYEVKLSIDGRYSQSVYFEVK